MSERSSLSAKRILITGTTGGIGGAVRDAVLARGWSVVEVNRGAFDASLGSEPLDGMVFATGTCPVTPLSLLTDDALLKTFEVNCGLFVRTVRRIVRERLANPAGMTVVAVSSVSAVEGWPGGTAYCASKGALSAVCRALDAELRPRGIGVRAVEPRYVKTRMFDAVAGRMGVDPKLARTPADLAEEIVEMMS